MKTAIYDQRLNRIKISWLFNKLCEDDFWNPKKKKGRCYVFKLLNLYEKN